MFTRCQICRKRIPPSAVGHVVDDLPWCAACFAEHGDSPFHRALSLQRAKRDPTAYQRADVVRRVEASASVGAQMFRLIAANCCPECAARDGELMTLAKALHEPPAPQPCCTRTLEWADEPHPWCICMVLAVWSE